MTDGAPREVDSADKGGGGWTALCVFGALISLFLAPFGGMWTNPAMIHPEWLLAVGSGTGVMVLSLWRSAHTRSWGQRAVLGLAILLSFPALLAPTYSWYESFHDFPWILILLYVLGLMWAGWRYGQRWLLLAILGFIACCGYGPSLPAGKRLPVTVQRDGVTLTVESMDRNQYVAFCNYAVRTPKGERLFGDLQPVCGSAGGLLPIQCWPGHEWSREPGQRPGEAHLSASTFPPEWVRSYDLTFTLQLLPHEAAVTLEVPLPPRGTTLTRMLTASGHGITLSVSNVRWLTRHSQSPTVPLPEFHLEYSGYSYAGNQGNEFQVTSLDDKPIKWNSWSTTGNQTVSTQEAYLEELPKNAKSFRIRAFNEAQLAEARRVFRVNGLPNPH